MPGAAATGCVIALRTEPGCEIRGDSALAVILYERQAAGACCVSASNRLVADTGPIQEVGLPGPLQAQRKVSIPGVGVGLERAGPGAGSSCGNAPLVEKALGWPGAAGSVTDGTDGPVAGAT